MTAALNRAQAPISTDAPEAELVARAVDGSEAAFETYRSIVANPLVKLILIGLLWAYLHHSLAGIRFLLLDAHKGLELETARMTAKVVFVAALVLTVILGVVLW